MNIAKRKSLEKTVFHRETVITHGVVIKQTNTSNPKYSRGWYIFDGIIYSPYVGDIKFNRNIPFNDGFSCLRVGDKIKVLAVPFRGEWIGVGFEKGRMR